ncbi:allantoinase [Thiomicrospira sp. XS5]|uniref:allantoinase PuuE n=1 Tax=Thiomicrospira sp. XS5 TaxID=1775636 RepID=UPI0007490D6A|nr:allantoinase PuuE [Thiomicrospira sp. XS5]KUJ75565.1 allantoinase [Thiomicrospira sp. XS5]
MEESNGLTYPDYPRDMVGYGANPPKVTWPGKAKLALQFVINYEEGGENCILHGDPASEAFLSEVMGASPWQGQRHMSIETIYEYGSRVGFWRLHRLFTEMGIPVTVFGVAMALQRNPEAVQAMLDADWEIASHGYRWIDYAAVDPEVERSHIRQALEIHTALTGQEPLGWYIGRNSDQTRRILLEETTPLYDSDSYSDELPFWVQEGDKPHLVVPYTLDANDMRFATSQGFNSGDQFFTYLKDSFDVLYAEGDVAPKMMSVGLHCRLVGRPGRFASLKRFIEYVRQHDDVWLCTRADIARHWAANHPA